MSSIELPVFRATFGPIETLRADDPSNVDKIGTPATVRVPNARGGISEQTGTVVEIRDRYMVIEFLQLDEPQEETMSVPNPPNQPNQPNPPNPPNPPTPPPGKPEDPPAT